MSEDYCGVGVMFSPGTTIVTAVSPESDLQFMDIGPADQVIGVREQGATDWTLVGGHNAIDHIRGPAGHPVDLQVNRYGLGTHVLQGVNRFPFTEVELADGSKELRLTDSAQACQIEMSAMDTPDHGLPPSLGHTSEKGREV